MKTSATGIALIQAFESCLKPTGNGRYGTYLCPAKVLTIGWGTTHDDAPDLKPGDVWTRETCDRVFADSLSVRYEPALAKRFPGVALTQSQYDALVSFVYNVGPGGLDGNVGRAVRDGRYDEVPMYLARWNKGGGKVLAGLVRRRKAEGQLWVGDRAAASKTAQTILPGTMPQSREAPAPNVTELARATPKTTAAVAAGTTTAAAGGTVPTEPDQIVASSVIVGFGVVVALVAVVVLARRWKALREDWA